MMAFFICNALESQLVSTGAFEISFNGKITFSIYLNTFSSIIYVSVVYFLDVPVWSKLQTGRIPQPQEVFQIIENHMNFAAPST